jgi:hypothetical protein
MTTFTIFMLVIIPMFWVAYQMWRARRAIVTTAQQQADLMDDMSLADAAQFAFLGRVDRARAATEPLPTAADE